MITRQIKKGKPRKQNKVSYELLCTVMLKGFPVAQLLKNPPAKWETWV